MSSEDTQALAEELAEFKRRRDTCKTSVYNFKEEMVFANMRSTETTDEISDLKQAHAVRMEILRADLESRREAWRHAEALVQQSCLDQKRNAVQEVNRLEEEQKENERSLTQIKNEIEIVQGLVRSNTRSFTFYGTLKEFVSAGLEERPSSRSVSVSSRVKSAFIKGLAPKNDKIPSIKLNSSFSIRSGTNA